jgi:hypothetical protein
MRTGVCSPGLQSNLTAQVERVQGSGFRTERPLPESDRRNEVSLLWEWLPATIIAVRRGGLPQKNLQLPLKPDFGVALHRLEHERFV